MSKKKLSDNQIAVYQTPDGSINIEVLYANENIWLPQKRIAELFDVDRSVVTKHLQNIFSSNELQEAAVCANYAHTAEDGKEYKTRFYPRLLCHRPEQTPFCHHRTNGRRNHRTTGRWLQTPHGSYLLAQGTAGKGLASDVVIAKNYLDKSELDHLNRIVTMYLDYAELQAVRQKPMAMKDWIEKLNAFLKFNEHEILTNPGSVSHDVAQALALREYGEFKKKQDAVYVSDFDQFLKHLPKGKAK